MTWLKKDDRFPNHRKIRRLSDGAYRLHDTAMCFAAHDETDGRLGPDDVTDMTHGHRLRRHVRDLIAAGLWHEPGHECAKCPPIYDGWVLHDFLDYNPSHEQLEAERAANRERQAKARARRRGVSTDSTEPADESAGHAVSHAVTNGDVTRESQPPVPNRSVPNRSVPNRSVPTRPGVGVLSVVGDGDQIQHVAVANGARNGSLGLGGEH